MAFYVTENCQPAYAESLIVMFIGTPKVFTRLKELQG